MIFNKEQEIESVLSGMFSSSNGALSIFIALIIGLGSVGCVSVF